MVQVNHLRANKDSRLESRERPGLRSVRATCRALRAAAAPLRAAFPPALLLHSSFLSARCNNMLQVYPALRAAAALHCACLPSCFAF